MQNITAPLKPGDRNDAVANLQKALQVLIEKGYLELDPAVIDKTIKLLHRDHLESFYGKTTGDLVQTFRIQHSLNAYNYVDDATADAINSILDKEGLLGGGQNITFTVSGTVRRPDDNPYPELVVRIYDRNLRKDDIQLADGKTGPAGDFNLRYSLTLGGIPGKIAANLVVSIFDPSGNEKLAESDVIYNASNVEIVNLYAGEPLASLSELNLIVKDMAPFHPDIPLSDLKTDEISFLSSATGFPVQRLEKLVQARQLSEKTSLPLDALYAFASKGLPIQDIHALAASDPNLLRQALDQAVAENLVSSDLLSSADQLISEKLPLARAQIMLQPAVEGQPASLGDVMSSMPAPLTVEKQLVLAQLVTNTNNESFSKHLVDSGFNGNEIDEVQVALKLGSLSRNHLPMLKELQQVRPTGENTLAFLAKLEGKDWQMIVEKTGAPASLSGETLEVKKQNYAALLEETVEKLLPTAVIANRIATQQFPVEGAILPALTRFFNQNPAFEFGSQFIAAYLAEGGGANLSGINPDLIPQVQAQLMKIERTIHLVERPSHAKFLLEMGFDSALQIAGQSKQTFVRFTSDQLPGGEAQAEIIYENASQKNAMAMTLLLRFGVDFNKVGIPVIQSHNSSDIPESLPGIPDLRRLFGGVDYCECDECQSVLSPAAYLVDVLKFLSGTKLPDKSSLLDRLFSRRPDLGGINLTCENTNTLLPYVDLVIELLENMVSPRPAGSYPQTTLPEDELAVTPENMNMKAYKYAIYPWNLPFSFSHEVGQAYLSLIGVTHQQIMEATQADTYLNDYPIALEVLRLDVMPAMFFTRPDWIEPYFLWGFDNVDGTMRVTGFLDTIAGEMRSGTWNSLLEYVSMFMQQARISFKELLNLLDTSYLTKNASAAQPLRLDGDECDLGKMKIVGLNSEVLSASHRFLRLQRSLSWNTSDLDKAISAYSLNERDDEFIKYLSHISRLQKLLNLPVVKILSFWSKMDTQDWVDHTQPGQPLNPSLYRQVFIDQAARMTGDNSLVLNADGSELASYTAAHEKISQHRAAVMAGLGLNSSDLLLLLKNDVEDELNLDNLSRLYSISILAKAMRLKISEFSTIKALTGIDIFAKTLRGKEASTTVLRFIDAVQFIRSSSIKIGELDYLLRDKATVTNSKADEEKINGLLVELRLGLQGVAAENRPQEDPQGEYVRQKLSQLGWDNELITQALGEAILNLEPRSTASLSAMPAGITFPDDLPSLLVGKVAFDSQENCLVTLGALRQTELEELEGLIPVDRKNDDDAKAYLDAVNSLFMASTLGITERINFVSHKLQSFEMPIHKIRPEFRVPMAGLLPGTHIPEDLPEEFRDRVAFDPVNKELVVTGLINPLEKVRLKESVSDDNFKNAVDQAAVWVEAPADINELFYFDLQKLDLCFHGWMTEAQNRKLRVLSDNSDYQDAVDTLFLKSNEYVEKNDNNQFLTPEHAETLFYDTRSIRERFDLIQSRFLPYLQNQQMEDYTAQKLSTILAIPVSAVRELLTNKLERQGKPGSKILQVFTDPLFVNSSLQIKPGRTTSLEQFNAIRRLQKVATFYTKYTLNPSELNLLFLGVPGWLDLNQLPTTLAATGIGFFAGWQKMDRLMRLRNDLPVVELVELANSGAGTTVLRDLLNKEMGWNTTDLNYATNNGRLNLVNPADFKDANKLTNLKTALDLAGILGIGVDKVWSWSKTLFSDDDVREIMVLAKSKFTPSTWVEPARTVRDNLRLKQRQVLVDYIVARDQTLANTNDLYDRLLIDPEMDPCMHTTRISQAINSIQLFVQRCLLGQESGILPSMIDMVQWNWMRNYRVWEANRAVFIHTENYIQPGLRKDKSPFFAELESELAQNEVTDEKATDILASYLEKLDDVARMEIVGMYLEKDDTTKEEVLHVFGRTLNTPQAYYYRRQVDKILWTAWEKIDLDIEGDHLIPVAWHKRLFLFWPIFTEKTRAPEPPKEGANPKLYWQIKMAFSEYKNGKWSAKRISPEEMTYPSDPVDSSEWKNYKKLSFAYRAEAMDQTVNIYCYGTVFSYVSEAPISSTIKPIILRAPSPLSTQNTHTENIDLGDSTSAVGQLGTIVGNVKDKDGKAVPGVVFKISNNGPVSLSSRSDKNGDYSIQEVKSGERKLTISSPAGYKYTGPNPRTLTVKLDKETVFDVVLEKETAAPTVELPALQFFKPIGSYLFDARLLVRTDITDLKDLTTLQRAERVGQSFVENDDNSVDSLVVDIRAETPPMHVLEQTPGHFRLLTPHQDERPLLTSPFFFWDNQRNFFVSPYEWFNWLEWWLAAINTFEGFSSVPKSDYNQLALKFKTFYHPHAGKFVQILNNKGLAQLLSLETQLLSVSNKFKDRYKPNENLMLPTTYPEEVVDFESDGAYSQYNWELFFHAPLLIADQLSKNQHFAEAQKWFHYIFDPTDHSENVPEPGRFWRTLPFSKAGKVPPIQELLKILADPKNNSPEKDQLEVSVRQWRKEPFMPHNIARLRIGAYQKNVVMRYIDNLIEWGDALFRQDTNETVNEATLHYKLASRILGPRPESIPPRTRATVQTYNSLAPLLDDFSNALVQAENLVPAPTTGHTLGGASPQPLSLTLAFCVPGNEQLLDYWDRVEDRLFKISHCMNIEGQVRDLAPFAPKINPALLVRAAAAGLDISAAASGANAPMPHYRFNSLAQKANEFCSEVKTFGAALLSALEKKDGEVLSQLRTRHEISLLTANREVKIQQIRDAQEALLGLAKNKEMAEARKGYYKDLLASKASVNIPAILQDSLTQRLTSSLDEFRSSLNDIAGQADPIGIISTFQQNADQIANQTSAFLNSLFPGPSQPTDIGSADQTRLPMNSFEKKNLDELALAHDEQLKALDNEALSQILALIPDFSIGAQGITSSPVSMAHFGGTQLSLFARLQANQNNYSASDHSYRANLHSILAGYQRREADWTLQAVLAAKEVEQISHQMLAAGIRLAISALELQNQEKQIEQAKEVSDFLQSKFTNDELYSWMVDKLSGLYFQSYKLAYDLARRAERAFCRELGVQNTDFIQFGYWDSMRKGLLAGEQLSLGMKRMEFAYFEKNRREYELTKHISLDQLDPLALLRLRQKGDCIIELPESLFDADYPGHYFRRIKSVSMTLPCIVGPYTSINCTLSLLKNKMRINSIATQDYHENSQEDDRRFIKDFVSLQSIATSHGQNDSGLFELNFRDERFLPFEGAGVISTWRIELPIETNAFELQSLRDVILHIHYTARDGGSALRSSAHRARIDEIETANGMMLKRMFSLRHDFPGEWHRFLYPITAKVKQEMELNLQSEQFPYLFQGHAIKISGAGLFLLLKDSPYKDTQAFKFKMEKINDAGDAFEPWLPPSDDPLIDKPAFTLAKTGSPVGLPYVQLFTELDEPLSKWRLVVPEGDLTKLEPWRKIVMINDTPHAYLDPNKIEDIFFFVQYYAGRN